MRHPNLDRLMIETLFKLHEEGTLNSFSEQLQAPPPSPLNPEKCLLQGAITSGTDDFESLETRDGGSEDQKYRLLLSSMFGHLASDFHPFGCF